MKKLVEGLVEKDSENEADDEGSEVLKGLDEVTIPIEKKLKK